jgi:hypothetical protein
MCSTFNVMVSSTIYLRTRFHVLVPIHFWKINELVKKRWRHVPINFTQWLLCKNMCQETGKSNSHEKDMCRLKSYSDRNSRSPWVHPWVWKAILFFKSFLLGTPRVPCSCIMMFSRIWNLITTNTYIKCNGIVSVSFNKIK